MSVEKATKCVLPIINILSTKYQHAGVFRSRGIHGDHFGNGI